MGEVRKVIEVHGLNYVSFPFDYDFIIVDIKEVIDTKEVEEG